VEPAETVVARERPCKRQETVGYCGDRGNATLEDCVKRCFLCGPRRDYITGAP
jgi:hypothetical protein